MVKSIYLQDGEEIFVDDEDYERVSQLTWFKYYSSKIGKNSKIISAEIKSKKVQLAPFILKGSFQKIKGSDFTRKNLTTKGNAQRWRKANHDSSSKYRGVSWDKKRSKWVASINVDGKRKYLGRYSVEEEAAKAYNKAVLDYWDGEGYINIIGEDNRTQIRDYMTFKNQHNRRAGLSGYKGVGRHTDKNRTLPFYAVSKFKKNKNFIGTFKTAEQAALAYNKVAIYLHGDEAILNDVQITDELKEFMANWEIPEKVIKLKEEAESNEHAHA